MIKWIDKTNESLLGATEWAGKNFKGIAILLALVLVIGAVWAGLDYTRDSKANKALLGYAPIEKDFSTWKTPAQAPKDDKAAAAKTPEKPAEKIDPAQLFGRMTDYIKANGDVPANELMALMASEVAAHLGPQQEAELLEISKKTFKTGSRLMDGLVLIKKGDLFVNQDKCDKALDQWKDVISNKRLTFLHDLARLKSGLCLEKLAKYNEAEVYYDQIIKGSENKTEAQKTAAALVKQNQWAVKEAQKLKRALKWSQKQPSS